MLDVIAEPPISAYAFTNASFTFGAHSDTMLPFSDGSGTYQLDLSNITTAEGNLNHQRKCPLMKIDEEKE